MRRMPWNAILLEKNVILHVKNTTESYLSCTRRMLRNAILHEKNAAECYLVREEYRESSSRKLVDMPIAQA